MKTRKQQANPGLGRSKRTGILSGEVTRQIKNAIFQGEFRSGDPLPEMHLAKRFGVSQAVVREALASLSHAGLVRRVPNMGTFVTSLTPTEIGELVRIRLLLESVAWVDAATRASGKDLEGLAAKLERMASGVRARDYDAVAQADLEFHREIWRMSGDETLARLLDQVTVPLMAFVSVRRNQRRDDLSAIVDEHQLIIGVLQRGDREEIVRECRAATERSYMGFLFPGFEESGGLVMATSARR